MKSLKKKMISILSTAIFVICVGIATIAFIVALISLKETSERDLSFLAEQIASTIEVSAEKKISTMNVIASMDEFTGKSTIAEKRNIMNAQLENIGCTRMNYIDSEGMLYNNEGDSYSVADREYFQNAMEGKVTVTNPTVSKADGTLVVIYVVPIISDDTVVGAVSAAFDGSELSNLVTGNVSGETGEGFIIDQSGVMIAGVDQDLVEMQFNLLSPEEETESNVTLKELANTMLTNESGTATYTNNGTIKKAAYTSIGTYGWYLCISMDKDEIYDGLNTLFVDMLAGTLICVLIGIFLVYKISDSIVKKVQTATSHMELLASGDLTVSVPAKQLALKDEFGTMASSMETMQTNVSEIVSSIKSSSNDVLENSQELSQVSNEIYKLSSTITQAISEIAEGTSVQTSELTAITSLLAEFSSQLQTMGKQILLVDDTSKKIDSMANKSSEEMNELNDSVGNVSAKFTNFENTIKKLGESVFEIRNITNMITEVANQTNLLALNASIEAARAGDAGKGFAVVAEEISNLAAQSKQSSENINQLIQHISTNSNELMDEANSMGGEIGNQMDTINRTIASFKMIIGEVENVIPKISQVKDSADEIEKNKNIIVSKMDELSSVSEEISASTEEISASTEELNASIEHVADASTHLSDITDGMIDQVDRFKI